MYNLKLKRRRAVTPFLYRYVLNMGYVEEIDLTGFDEEPHEWAGQVNREEGLSQISAPIGALKYTFPTF